MRKVFETRNGSWVATQGDFSKEESRHITENLARRIKGAQTWFFDLDNTHAPSPAISIAKRAVGTHYLSPLYIDWCARAAWKLAEGKEGVESELWIEYVKRFLQDENSLRVVGEIFTPQFVKDSLYAGVKGFCSIIWAAQKYYVTRNISPVAQAYTALLGFDGFFAESYDKGSVVEAYITQNPHVKRFGVEGDSQEDAQMIERLRFYGRDVVGICSEQKPDHVLAKQFDVFVSKDRSALVQILRECDGTKKVL